jgi:hypothetical protein
MTGMMNVIFAVVADGTTQHSTAHAHRGARKKICLYLEEFRCVAAGTRDMHKKGENTREREITLSSQ